MSDYYAILGVTKTATDIEIKGAFRKLAKIYHPDKNPNNANAKVLFENILTAYNTLINPHRRKRYDQLGIQQPNAKTQSPRNKHQKDYTATEEELKQRQYYKNYYHSKKQTINTAPPKNTYSDYKYILFATPLAVGLLMLILSLFSNEPKINSSTIQTLPLQVDNSSTAINSLKNGDKPYEDYFGSIKTFATNHHLKINNTSNYDAIIAVFEKQTNAYLQHSYLQASYSIDLLLLPNTGVYWKCILGKNWNKDKLQFNKTVYGGFDSIVQFQNWKTLPIIFTKDQYDEINLLYVLNDTLKENQYISNEFEFFER
jgi:curved DNA-binding protein CbpA